MKLLNAEQIRLWDQFTIEHEPISSISLMERAALKCTEWIIDHQLTDRPIKILCGKGNNGGDGLAIARQLIERDIHPEIYILEFGNRGTDDFQVNLARLHCLTANIHFIQSESAFPELDSKDIVIDALLGSGLNRGLEGLSAALIDHINNANTTVISIDVPSGMFIDRSSQENTVIKAHHTLTFQCLKLCLLAAENSDSFGEVYVRDIGLHPDFLSTISTQLHLFEYTDAVALFQSRKTFSHKGDHGHALIIGGSEGKTGAAIIATEACLRAGAGLTSVHLVKGDNTAVNARCPEAMTLPGDEIAKKNLFRYNAIAAGPGLGTDDIAVHLVTFLLENYENTLVIDADALNVLSEYVGWLHQLPLNTILTPHPKEFDRLFGAHKTIFDRWDAAISKSKELGCIIVLKDHYTLVAVNGEGYFNTTGNAGLAKGGSGDALTGIIAALLAQHYEPSNAAKLAVFIHGLAADLAVEEQSYESLIASDVSKHLGKAFKKLSNVS